MANRSSKLLVPLGVALFTALGLNSLHAQAPVKLLGSDCTPGPDNPINEPGTERTYVLDYPCDLQADEPVTVILNLHGTGSNTLYQHAYFPAGELEEEKRLVIATPHSPIAFWVEDADQYLQNITSAVIDAGRPTQAGAGV